MVWILQSVGSETHPVGHDDAGNLRGSTLIYLIPERLIS
ncbi:hypothetical protein BvCmsKSNP091_02678 [Escherichia coli]|nr:hypothetical protein BvCmsE63A_00195 [Escherichia coli]GCL22885.1 hypothetical protein BvCmsE63A_01378 [Escherichia coli]GCL23279.1 hypothetical protein BvCmsE63A_01783 [Escherichia coli]GCL24239.1 hypothetical protein BvCmsE63A_02758 [Escherichia coli]GCL25679.1 hypothetical protein BvCmsE63A_04218 [Escherichia coli]